MKQNIIYIILLMIISIFTNLVHASLTIKPNIEGGIYNNTIEINLISNDKKAKIFYYTDGEGRLDNQKEYKGVPIVIKESTTLNYHAIIDIKNSTLVEETKYTLNYPKNFSVSYNNGSIEIKNNNDEIVNISYWKIEADSINYEIYKNTFLKNGELYKLDYKAKELEKISFISPDNRVILNYQIPKIIIKKEVASKVKNTNIELKEELVLIEPEVKIKSEKTIIEDNKSELINNNQIQNFDSKEKKVEGGFDINKHLKSSISDIETKQNNKIIYILILLFILGLIYKIYMNFTKIKKID